jgi:FAD synthase
MLKLYGKDISVSFIERVREDRTFPNIDDLLKQMDHDGAQAREILEKYKDSQSSLLLANKGNG